MMALQLQDELRGEILLGEPLSRHTSWRVGGPARRFYRPADSDDLLVFLRELSPDEPLLWLGLGSNLLVRDGGFDGTVIATRGRLEGLELTGDHLLRAEAGVACAKVARMAARQGLVGSEFLAGIPGTLGGALAMNAGAWWWRDLEPGPTGGDRGPTRQAARPLAGGLRDRLQACAGATGRVVYRRNPGTP